MHLRGHRADWRVVLGLAALLGMTATPPLDGQICRPDSASAAAAVPRPVNYIFFRNEHERIAEPSFLSNPSIAGAQLTFTWRELEPERGRVYRKTAEVLREALGRALGPSLIPVQHEMDAPIALWRDYALLLVSLASAMFVLFAAVFGPYDIQDGLEAVVASAVVSLLISLPVLGWLWWRRRRVVQPGM